MIRSSLRAVLLCTALCATLSSIAAAAPDPAYTALRGARPDGRKITVKDVALDRDVFHFQFDNGTFHLLAPVDGRTVGAVFVGHGSFKLTPATPGERRQLALSSGAGENLESLTDSFDSLVLFFLDDTDAEFQAKSTVENGAPDAKAVQVYESWLKKQRQDFKINFHLRVFQDLLNAPGVKTGLFLALLGGQKTPPALAAVDPNGAEALLGGRLGGEDVVFYVHDQSRGGLWYLSDRKNELASHQPHPEQRLADAINYRIETTVEKSDDLAGTATVRFHPLVAGLRVLPVLLMPRLRIHEAAWAIDTGGTEPAWQPASWVQENEDGDSDAAAVFPQPLAFDRNKETTILLRLSYRGDKVLRDVGDKNYVVGARESWYPNLGVFSDPAAFDLVYRVPAGNEVISVGRKTGERSEGKLAVSTWQTEGPVQVAGFNYGKFKKLEKKDEDTKLQLAVFTNPGTPDIVREIKDAMGDGPNLGVVNTARLADGAMVDGLNSAHLFTTYFGPLPQTQIAITQQSNFFFGQSWPSLIFLPYIAFLDSTQRQRLGLLGAKDFVNQVGFHEFAHQWWGHLVGAATYRDVWLEEGFAEFSAALAVQHTQGWPEYDRFWTDARKRITAKEPGNTLPCYQAGPVTQGHRLSTSRTPSAYQAIVYEKGGYILHMLRMLMWDSHSKIPDEKFIAMMKDYTATYAGKVATTADFQKIVEKHMVPNLNATGDGKMDWFFNQWVYGTEIPHYVTDLAVKQEGDTWHITGKIVQEGVSPSFRTPVPLYLEFDKGEKVLIGLTGMIGESTKTVDVKNLKLPKKPKRALVNGRGEVLARD